MKKCLSENILLNTTINNEFFDVRRKAQTNNADRIGGSESVIVAAIVHVWCRIIIVTYFT